MCTILNSALIGMKDISLSTIWYYNFLSWNYFYIQGCPLENLENMEKS